jgi:NTP pyrophosphatase (non-canonical NTP hydrolase)
MEDNPYEQAVLRTVSNQFNHDFVDHLLQHAIDGIASEAGELVDARKKTLYYGTVFDRTNAIEELGDLMYYIQLAASRLNVTLEDLKRINIAKLRKRYPEGVFSADRACNRDLTQERLTLNHAFNTVTRKGVE